MLQFCAPAGDQNTLDSDVPTACARAASRRRQRRPRDGRAASTPRAPQPVAHWKNADRHQAMAPESHWTVSPEA
eukprot:3592209-Pyramimonas_sp.AAC.1